MQPRLLVQAAEAELKRGHFAESDGHSSASRPSRKWFKALVSIRLSCGEGFAVRRPKRDSTIPVVRYVWIILTRSLDLECHSDHVLEGVGVGVKVGNGVRVGGTGVGVEVGTGVGVGGTVGVGIGVGVGVGVQVGNGVGVGGTGVGVQVGTGVAVGGTTFGEEPGIGVGVGDTEEDVEVGSGLGSVAGVDEGAVRALLPV